MAQAYTIMVHGKVRRYPTLEDAESVANEGINIPDSPASACQGSRKRGAL
jgi:hypothetical protein